MSGRFVFPAVVIGVPLAIIILPNLFSVPADHKVYREDANGHMVEVVESESGSSSQTATYPTYNGHTFDPNKSMYENMSDAGMLKFKNAIENSEYIESTSKGPGTRYYIKGNISYNTGERIYHLPGDAYYEQTVIDESAGERWFSSEEEAIAAGWRHAYI